MAETLIKTLWTRKARAKLAWAREYTMRAAESMDAVVEQVPEMAPHAALLRKLAGEHTALLKEIDANEEAARLAASAAR